MRKTTKFKILMLMMCLVFGNLFIWIVYFSVPNRTKTTNKEIIYYKSKLTRKQKEDLVELTKENSHLNYINNYCLTYEN